MSFDEVITKLTVLGLSAVLHLVGLKTCLDLATGPMGDGIKILIGLFGLGIMLHAFLVWPIVWRSK